MCLGPLVTARATGNWSRSAVRPARVKPTPLPANSTPFRPPRANVPLLSASPATCRFSSRGYCVSGQSAITTGAAANAIAPCNCVIANTFAHLSEKSRRFPELFNQVGVGHHYVVEFADSGVGDLE